MAAAADSSLDFIANNGEPLSTLMLQTLRFARRRRTCDGQSREGARDGLLKRVLAKRLFQNDAGTGTLDARRVAAYARDYRGRCRQQRFTDYLTCRLRTCGMDKNVSRCNQLDDIRRVGNDTHASLES